MEKKGEFQVIYRRQSMICAWLAMHVCTYMCECMDVCTSVLACIQLPCVMMQNFGFCLSSLLEPRRLSHSVWSGDECRIKLNTLAIFKLRIPIGIVGHVEA